MALFPNWYFTYHPEDKQEIFNSFKKGQRVVGPEFDEGYRSATVLGNPYFYTHKKNGIGQRIYAPKGPLINIMYDNHIIYKVNLSDVEMDATAAMNIVSKDFKHKIGSDDVFKNVMEYANQRKKITGRRSRRRHSRRSRRSRRNRRRSTN
tara:strand:- start:20 stop:469 length:450 start_codon:yes stop_codon:yes gene_type:complete